MPLQLDDGDGAAAGAVLVGPLVVGAEQAGDLVGLVLVPVTQLAVPAARHPLHHLLPLARPARLAAHRGGHGARPSAPLHLLHLWDTDSLG